MLTGRHLVFVLISLFTVASSVTAQELIDRRRRDNYRIEPSASVSLDQAVEMAQRRYHAKAVRAETVRKGERLVHQVRLLSTEGKVWTVNVDAQSGAMQ